VWPCAGTEAARPHAQRIREMLSRARARRGLHAHATGGTSLQMSQRVRDPTRSARDPTACDPRRMPNLSGNLHRVLCLRLLLSIFHVSYSEPNFLRFEPNFVLQQADDL
jgi:hypothetical protein